MQNPQISICIPAYKEPQLMKECLESIVNQTYTNYEVVITDDTPDNSIGIIIDEFRQKIKSLRYYKNPKALGSPKNWNECIEKATGDYIKIIHRDDKFSSNDSLQAFASKIISNPGVGFLFSETKVNDVIGKNEYVLKSNKTKINKLKENPLLLLTGNVIGAPSVTIFKKTKIHFDENLKWLVDIDFYIQIIKNFDFIYIDKPLMKVSAGGDWQVTKDCMNKEIEFSEWFYLYKKYKLKEKYSAKEILHLFKLIHRYKIRSINELKSIVEVPNEKIVARIIIFNKLFQ